MLRVLAASTALVACNAHAQYGGGSGRPVIGLPPSVELNLDVLTKLRPAPLQEMRKVPSEQPYSPPVRLPALAQPTASITARPVASMPFAKGESGANILSDVSSANYKPEVKTPAPRTPPVRPAAAPKPAAAVAAPVPKAPAPLIPKAPVPIVTVPAAPKPPAPAVVPPAAPAPIVTAPAAPKPVVPAVVPPAAPAPMSAPQPMSIVPPVNNAPMMIPVTPRTAPVPMVPHEIPVQPAPIAAPMLKPVAPAIVPPAPLPTGAVPPASVPVTKPVAAPLPIVPPAAVIPPAAPKPAPSASVVPPMAPIPMAAKPSLNVPPPPSLDGLDFSNMKATDPDGLGDLTPQKLLGKPVETMVVSKPSTLPEIEVPAATSTEKLPTVVKEKPADTMLPSISNRVDKLFTKDDVKMGMQSDTTRVINPVADKQKELAAKKAEAEKATPPKLPELGALPPLPLPEPVPKEKSIKITDAKPEQTIKLASEPPAGLPSLDAITGTKAPESSMDIVQPKDGIIASEKMPPAKLPEPIQVPLPVVKKVEAPKVVVEEKKPALPMPVPMPMPTPKVEAPKPPAVPLAITPKEKPNIKEDTKIAALPPLPDFGNTVRKPDPALAPALPQLPPPAKLEAKKPAPVKEAPAKIEPIKMPEVQVKAPKAEVPKPAASLNVPKPSSAGNGKPSASVGFGKDATDLSPSAKTELMDLADNIKKNDASVRIVAYAKGSEDEASIARRISLSRALQVRAFLIDKGVNQLKINVQAMGHKVPSGNADRADVVVY